MFYEKKIADFLNLVLRIFSETTDPICLRF